MHLPVATLTEDEATVLFGLGVILLIVAYNAYSAYLEHQKKLHGLPPSPPGGLRIQFTRSRPSGGAEPACGACGYSVRGLSTMICPECGSDLREVGIVPPAKSPAKDRKPVQGAASTSRTVTILLTDMKDYTARAQESSRDDGVALLRRHRDIVQPIVQQRAGRIVKSTGDGLIAVFDSATDSLLAGMQIQRAVALNNEQSFTEQTKFLLRIAVSTGEVTLTDDDVLGQPVNLASRVQQFAQPGEVCFTESTYHAMNRKEVTAQAMEPVEVKGIAGKVNLYRCA